jgi:hypothetical protein
MGGRCGLCPPLSKQARESEIERLTKTRLQGKGRLVFEARKYLIEARKVS